MASLVPMQGQLSLLTPGEHYQRSAMASFRLDKLVPCRFSYSLLTPGEHYQRSAMASFRLDKLVPMQGQLQSPYTRRTLPKISYGFL